MWTSQLLLAPQPGDKNFISFSGKDHHQHHHQQQQQQHDNNASIEAVWLDDGVISSSSTTTSKNHTTKKTTTSSTTNMATTTTTTKQQLEVAQPGSSSPSSTSSTSNTTKKLGAKAAAKIKSILAALSFETNHPIVVEALSSANTAKSEQQQQQQRACGGGGGLLRRRNKKKNPKKSTSGGASTAGVLRLSNNNTDEKNTTTNNLTRVECGSSGSNDDIYFDALQFGDATNNRDDFDHQNNGQPRESIVLSGVVLVTTTTKKNARGTATELTSTFPPHNDHDNIETVLQQTTNKTIEPAVEKEEDDTTSSSPCSSSDDATSSTDDEEEDAVILPSRPVRGPPSPRELPLRFLRAGKNDPIEGLRRYESTLQMRSSQQLDTILRESNFDFDSIKQHYPHYCHGRGRNGEPCFYEQPPRTNLKALQQVGVTVDRLLRHYTMVTEYQWQYLERDDLAKSIYIIDLQGIRLTDFAGEAVEFLKKASKFSAEHYPERAGCVFVINVPGWFKIIWNVVKPIIDESTLKKIYILRGKDEIRSNMEERIAIEHIPPEYGGTSVPLGTSVEERTLAAWVEHNNRLARAGQTACPCNVQCRFCDWAPARSY